MALRLEGKVAIVTGAAGGIGQAICTKFANEGASVVLVDCNEEELEKVFKSFAEQHGNNHLKIAGDVAEADVNKKIFATTSEKFGNPGQILVNCVGSRETMLLFMQTSEEMYDHIMKVFLKTTFMTTKAFGEALKTENGMRKASIINMSSLAGKNGAQSASVYAAAKAGVIALTKSIGAELGEYGIRCNAVLPGLTITEASAVVPADAKEYMRQATPLKKLGYPEDVANVCLFLASDESSHVTCGCLEVGGGYGA